MIVRYSSRADADLISIGLWIARDDPRRSISFVRELRDACEDLADFPERYPLVQGRRDLRKRIVWPYLILYQVREEDILIVSVRHGARRALR